jgi:chromosome segregation ATPase
MAPEMSFAQALNEAKGVIIQLSNRVKADAEKLRAQQSRIDEQEAALNAAADEVAAMRERLNAANSAREQAEAIINRQGEKITALQNASADADARIEAYRAQVAQVAAERDALRNQLPSNEDAAALAAMTHLLSKAAPVLEKARRAAGASNMRITPDTAGDAPIAEAA